MNKNEITLDDVSFVTYKESQESDSWQYRTTKERTVTGKLAEDVRAKLGMSPYGGVFITESQWAEGYSTWTHWDEYEVILRCGDFEKIFVPTYEASVVVQIINWIEGKE